MRLEWTVETTLQSSAVVLKDYSYQRPTKPLEQAVQAFLGAAGLEMLGGLALQCLDIDVRVGGMRERFMEQFRRVRGVQLEFGRAAGGALRGREVFLRPADAVDLDLDDHAAAFASECRCLAQGFAHGAGGERGFRFVEENAHMKHPWVRAGPAFPSWERLRTTLRSHAIGRDFGPIE